VQEKKMVNQPVLLEKKSEYEVVDGYGEIIKKAREKINLSQKELAGRIKIKDNILKRIEAGRLTPDEDLARRIEKELQIKILERVEEKYAKKEFKKAELTIGDVAKID
jgi:putative transcription factor